MSVPMKYLIFFSILIASALGNSFAFANPCEDTRQLKNLWESKYIKLVQNPEALGSGFDRSSMAYKLANAICILEYPGLPDDDGKFYRYLKAFITDITVVLTSGDQSSASINPQIPNQLFIRRGFFVEEKDMKFARPAILMHEIRHSELSSESRPNSHTICKNGRDIGKKLCDDELSLRWELASPTSYEILFLNSLTEKSFYYKNNSYINNYINDSLNNYFNHIPQNIYKRIYKSQ